MNHSENEHSSIRNEDDSLVEAAVRLLPPLGPSLYGAISHLAQTFGLTPAQVKVMLQVGADGQMTIGEIACRLHASMAATSEIVDRLVEAGHLDRASDQTDRRRVLISASEGSLRILEELHELRRAQVRGALAELTPEERPVFVRALDALLVGLTTVSGVASQSCPTGLSGQGDSEPSSPPPRGAPVATVSTVARPTT